MNQVVRYDEVIDRVEGDFTQLAPSNIKFQAERGFALQHLQSNDYLLKVAQGNPISLAQAMKNVAAIGLSLNPAKKQAYLIPRNIKVGKEWVSKICLEPSYMGLCDLATGLGTILWVQARCVYKADKFTDNGTGERPTHIYDVFATTEERGEFVGAYCVAKTKEGDYLTTTLNAEAIYKIRDKSETWKKAVADGKQGAGPWLDHFEEQAKKTVVRNAYKMWPKGEGMERLEHAVQMSNENEGFEPIQTAPTLHNFTASEKQYFDKLISDNDAMRMYIFMNSLSEGVQTNLYNSFEKGTIGKYKAIVTKLNTEGYSLLVDIRVAMDDAAAQGDDLAVKELLDDLPQEAIDWLAEKCGDDARKMISECVA